MPRRRNKQDPASDHIRHDLNKPLKYGHHTDRDEIDEKAEELSDKGLESRKRRY